MPAIQLLLQGDGAWPDLPERMARPCTVAEAEGLQVAALDCARVYQLAADLSLAPPVDLSTLSEDVRAKLARYRAPILARRPN